MTGEDGPSLMGLEDMAMFRALPTATIFYPSDGVSAEKAVELAANTKVKPHREVWDLLKYLYNILHLIAISLFTYQNA